ncbi:galactosyldiacylglycerol synthase [Aerolutibacter ruishenii]|uniref:Galactosyldiacylglycerol synthase n=1 Tax=Aerolutibacter ruishenii TaxID=686800 RepID=A0A562LXZ3_9GAMM|nr:galactosyldiacylglycerol synthase [Lysobacter ruishenii]TWI12515.1 hypothetical protein IP93_00856 [Lysobacter ruishenii]
MSVRISEKETGRSIGEISDHDLEILIGHMEEESSRDQDYFVETTAIDALERLGASAAFVAMLRGAAANSDGIDIVWSRR